MKENLLSELQEALIYLFDEHSMDLTGDMQCIVNIHQKNLANLLSLRDKKLSQKTIISLKRIMIEIWQNQLDIIYPDEGI